MGIDTTTESVPLILNDLEFGADIGASGRARLPTLEKNSRSAFKYGDRLQEALQDLILQGAKLGPLFEEEVDLTTAKFHAMGSKLKPSGKSCGLFKTNAGVRRDPGFVYSPSCAGSLKSTIDNAKFPVNLTSLSAFHGKNAKI